MAVKQSDQVNRSGPIRFAISGAILGLAAFLLIYGHYSLDVTDPFWIYESGDTDLISHQLGFDLFRSQDWSVPPGIIRDYPRGQVASVVYSDVIPIRLRALSSSILLYSSSIASSGLILFSLSSLLNSLK